MTVVVEDIVADEVDFGTIVASAGSSPEIESMHWSETGYVRVPVVVERLFESIEPSRQLVRELDLKGRALESSEWDTTVPPLRHLRQLDSHTRRSTNR